jgi:hypothetical protein
VPSRRDDPNIQDGTHTMKTDLQTGENALAEIPREAKTVSSPDSKLRFLALAIVIIVGFVRVWVGRYSISPDGICYLDQGDAFFHGKLSYAINGLWSPLYSWLLGAALFVAKPSRWWEFPVAHLVNFLIYLATLLCFEFFLRSLWQDVRWNLPPIDTPNIQSLSKNSLFAIGYAVFLWTSLELITIWELSPDLAVAAFVYLIAGLLLRLRQDNSFKLYMLLGIVLGLAYLTKAVFFPLGFLFILVGLGLVPRQKYLAYLLLVTACFVAISAPWLVALSRAKGRFDFGDSGRLNYSALVSPGGRLLNWQGEPPGSGVPVHTTRKIHENPPVYEFAAPVGGTYPPSYDPSYWNEGREWTFDARRQLKVIEDHVLTYAELLLRSQSGLLAGALTLVLVRGMATRKSLLRNWPLFALCLAPMALYMLVHVEVRYVGAYLAVFWMAILFSIRLANSDSVRRMAELLAVAVVVTILLSVADGTMHAVRAGGPYSARDQITVADGLKKMGLHAGDHVAILGDGNWAYWARLGKLKIVSTIMSPDTPAFWAETLEQKEEVLRLLADTGAKAVVAAQVPASDAGNGWERIGVTENYVRWLSPSSRTVKLGGVTD